MEKIKLVAFIKHIFMFSILSLFLAACSMDGNDEAADVIDSKLDRSPTSKMPGLLLENKEFLDALNKQPKNPNRIIDPEIDPFARSNKKWVAMASGDGQNYDPFYQTNFAFKFSAKEDSEGNDVGWVNWSDADGNLIAAGEVDCLYVEGNRAWLRFSDYYSEVHWFIWIGFEDNGEGSKALPDRNTGIHGVPAIYGQFSTCESFAETNGFGSGFTSEWIKGNIQVRHK